MPTCKLCLGKEANKKNTHYLTDAIIRSCLNINGVNEREKGLYFSIDNANPFMDFNFQRLDEQTLENAIGRKPTEGEIENAKSIPFSVDYIFCSDCEKLFTEVENSFIRDILPRFRKADLTGRENLSVEENVICRSFFQIQIFRSAVCTNVLQFSDDFIEKLRIIILEKSEDSTIPLCVTYLQTLGTEENYTANYVGFTSDKNPFFIFMNDFVIQVYENNNDVKFVSFYGLNDEVDYKQYINSKETSFCFKVLMEEKKKTILKDIITDNVIDDKIQFYRNTSTSIWRHVFGVYPNSFQVDKYIQLLASDDKNNILKYTREQMHNFTVNYFREILNI